MDQLMRALWAEMLKMKRTVALRLAFIAPAAVVVYCLLWFWGEEPEPQHNMWLELWQMGRIFWTLLMLPLFVTLQSALLSGLEHRNGQWKQLFAVRS